MSYPKSLLFPIDHNQSLGVPRYLGPPSDPDSPVPHIDRQRRMDLVTKTFHVQNHRLLTTALLGASMLRSQNSLEKMDPATRLTGARNGGCCDDYEIAILWIILSFPAKHQ